MRVVLVPVDGSKCSDKALDVAQDLARARGAAIRVMHVLLRDKEPEELLGLSDIVSGDQDIINQLTDLSESPERSVTAAEVMANPNTAVKPVPEPLLRRIGEIILERAQARVGESGIETAVEEITDAPIASAIVDKAQSLDADMIVMGMRGLRLGAAAAIGSVSQDVSRKANCTCVAVH